MAAGSGVVWKKLCVSSICRRRRRRRPSSRMPPGCIGPRCRFGEQDMCRPPSVEAPRVANLSPCPDDNFPFSYGCVKPHFRFPHAARCSSRGPWCSRSFLGFSSSLLASGFLQVSLLFATKFLYRQCINYSSRKRGTCDFTGTPTHSYTHSVTQSLTHRGYKQPNPFRYARRDQDKTCVKWERERLAQTPRSLFSPTEKKNIEGPNWKHQRDPGSWVHRQEWKNRRPRHGREEGKERKEEERKKNHLFTLNRPARSLARSPPSSGREFRRMGGRLK